MNGSKPPTGDGSRSNHRAHRRPVRKLKPGPGLAPEVVYADQQRRLRKAMIELVADGGFELVTVRALTKEAGVSTRTFYRHFASTAECFGLACESTMLGALRGMQEAGGSAQHWEDGLRAAVTSMMEQVAGHPDAARVMLVDAFAGGSSVSSQVDAVTETFERFLADLLGKAPRPTMVPRQLLSGMVAGAMRVARTTTMAGQAHELPGLAPDLSDWLLSVARAGALRPSAMAHSGSASRREIDPFPDQRRSSDVGSIGDERERIFRAAVRLAAADGLRGLTIPRIRSAAGVSRRKFNSHFSSVDECFLDSLEWMARSAAARAQSWVGDDADMDRRVHRLMLALCAQAARSRSLATLAFVAILDPGRAGLLRREHLVTLGAEQIRGNLLPLGRAGDLALEASVAAVWQMAHAEVATGRAEYLPGLAPLLAQVILTPISISEGVAEGAGARDRQH